MASLRRSLARMMKRLWTRENALALGLCLLILALAVMLTDTAPTWIYQSF